MAPGPQHKSIGMVIALSIVTFGFYAIYWCTSQGSAARQATGRSDLRTLGVWNYILLGGSIILMAVWFVAYLRFVFAGINQPEPPIDVVVWFFASYAAMLLLAVANTVVWFVLSIKALQAIRDWNNARGATTTMEPMLMLLMLAVNIWPLIHLPIAQSDINKGQAPH